MTPSAGDGSEAHKDQKIASHSDLAIFAHTDAHTSIDIKTSRCHQINRSYSEFNGT